MVETAALTGARFARISGWGMHAPERVVTNSDLARAVDTTDEWIISHTGIRERHVASGERETTATLALRASRKALLCAGLSPLRLDLIIVATATPEHIFPSTASLLQDALGASHAGAYDLSAGCSGFVYALSMASAAIRSGDASHVLVVGAETMSRVTDWGDRNTCVLFGDGAGAVIVSAEQTRCGVMSTVLGSDGSGGDLLIIPAGGSRIPASHESVANGGHYIKMNGREVYRFATTAIPKATEAVVEKAGWKVRDLSLIIPHQANSRIIEAAAKRLEVPPERFFMNLDRYGNTSAASIPIAICEAAGTGRLRPGDRVVLVGFGAGLSWAAAAVEWGEPATVARAGQAGRLGARLRLRLAGARSAIRRNERHFYNWIMGPVGKDDWRGRLRRRSDRARANASQFLDPDA